MPLKNAYANKDGGHVSQDQGSMQLVHGIFIYIYKNQHSVIYQFVDIFESTTVQKQPGCDAVIMNSSPYGPNMTRTQMSPMAFNSLFKIGLHK